ncbi:FAD binding domain-containing protein [Candidatus Formimonas warabiya]|nr:xanthine dehydrogenase family protein subunit M [Candidatus Formimonas warabiya]
MKAFDYFKPKDISEAMALKADKKESFFLAGGTDLFVKMKNGALTAQTVIDIGELDSLGGIHEDEREMIIGAACKVSEIEKSDHIRGKYAALAGAAHSLGSLQVRNLATIGGNICNASPSADLLPALLVLNAKMEIIGPRGIRLVPAEEFFVGPGATILERGELLKSIRIPLLSREKAATVYLKHTLKRSMDIAAVGVAILVEDKEVVNNCRIALGAVGPTPFRVYEAEKHLLDKKLNGEVIAQAALLCKEACKPIDDVRTTAAYRKTIVEVLAKRGLEKIAGEQGGRLDGASH